MGLRGDPVLSSGTECLRSPEQGSPVAEDIGQQLPEVQAHSRDLIPCSIMDKPRYQTSKFMLGQQLSAGPGRANDSLDSLLSLRLGQIVCFLCIPLIQEELSNNLHTCVCCD